MPAISCSRRAAHFTSSSRHRPVKCPGQQRAGRRRRHPGWRRPRCGLPRTAAFPECKDSKARQLTHQTTCSRCVYRSCHACLQAGIALAGRCRRRPPLALTHLGAGGEAAALDSPSARGLGLRALDAGGRIRGHGGVLATTTASSLPTTAALPTPLCATTALGGRHGGGHSVAGSVQCSEIGFK